MTAPVTPEKSATDTYSLPSVYEKTAEPITSQPSGISAYMATFWGSRWGKLGSAYRAERDGRDHQAKLTQRRQVAQSLQQGLANLDQDITFDPRTVGSLARLNQLLGKYGLCIAGTDAEDLAQLRHSIARQRRKVEQLKIRITNASVSGVSHFSEAVGAGIDYTSRSRRRRRRDLGDVVNRSIDTVKDIADIAMLTDDLNFAKEHLAALEKRLLVMTGGDYDKVQAWAKAYRDRIKLVRYHDEADFKKQLLGHQLKFKYNPKRQLSKLESKLKSRYELACSQSRRLWGDVGLMAAGTAATVAGGVLLFTATPLAIAGGVACAGAGLGLFSWGAYDTGPTTWDCQAEIPKDEQLLEKVKEVATAGDGPYGAYQMRT